MSDPTPPAAPVRTRRGVKIALGLSLALNLLIAGAIGGAIVGGHPERPGMDEPSDFLRSLGLGPLAHALGDRDRRDMMERIARNPQETRTARGALLRATRDFAEAVRTEPFDRTAAEAVLERQRGLMAGLQGQGHTLLLDQISGMSAGDRAAFADRLSRRLPRLRGE